MLSTTDPIVTVVSSSSDGPELRPHLHIHEKLLFASSPILKKLTEPTVGVATRIQISRLELNLPFQGLRNLSHWLYHREAPIKASEDIVDNKISSQLIGLIHGYNVGERLQIVDFADVCTSSLLGLLDEKGDLTSLVRLMPAIASYTRPGSRIRKLIVDWIVTAEDESKHAVDNSVWQAFMSDQNFCSMLLDAFYKRKLEHQVCLRHVERLHKLTPCVYHWHVELGRPCYLTLNAHDNANGAAQMLRNGQQSCETKGAVASDSGEPKDSGGRAFVKV
ncbi:hypothetical protein CB0940_00892 [Cercospora beticola]|uniref:BTB domain-containing protein n=1 Tax=Cercospora beticola TaxID=122368 RepID=A0A2G5I8L4_CERBT|nr:hypothetical protein CB0940_00892 [Cercospora beticola]PIB01196.1 hypothetical protein CB0940_00892 [Cercospora beticola]WPA96320.1 hypothetical protein RHO25_000926 [Cercospora beticola]